MFCETKIFILWDMMWRELRYAARTRQNIHSIIGTEIIFTSISPLTSLMSVAFLFQFHFLCTINHFWTIVRTKILVEWLLLILQTIFTMIEKTSWLLSCEVFTILFIIKVSISLYFKKNNRTKKWKLIWGGIIATADYSKLHIIK